LPWPRAGHLPFEGREKADIKRAITLHRMRPLPPSISPACADFVRAMLTHDAALRPSAAALLGHPYLLAHAPLEQRLSAPAALPPGRLSGERSGHTPPVPCFPRPALPQKSEQDATGRPAAGPGSGTDAALAAPRRPGGGLRGERAGGGGGRGDGAGDAAAAAGDGPQRPHRRLGHVHGQQRDRRRCVPRRRCRPAPALHLSFSPAICRWASESHWLRRADAESMSRDIDGHVFAAPRRPNELHVPAPRL
jgi:hypothetical protein